MNGTHETTSVKVTALNGTHVLVGECGGLSAVYNVQQSTIIPGSYEIECEHGVLFVHKEQKLEVLADK